MDYNHNRYHAPFYCNISQNHFLWSHLANNLSLLCPEEREPSHFQKAWSCKCFFLYQTMVWYRSKPSACESRSVWFLSNSKSFMDRKDHLMTVFCSTCVYRHWKRRRAWLRRCLIYLCTPCSPDSCKLACNCNNQYLKSAFISSSCRPIWPRWILQDHLPLLAHC